MPPDIDEHTVDLLAERVAARLRDELEAIASDVVRAATTRHLTVEEVAERFGVTRSTVYAHWREWGGYKLGSGERAPIRFMEAALHPPAIGVSEAPTPVARKRRARRDLLDDNPKREHLLDTAG